MPRYPVIVLIGALMAVGVGLMMILLSGPNDEFVWYALPIIALGLLLAWLWFRDRRATRDAPPVVGSPPPELPGKWYPVAILTIFAATLAWFVYWTKFRK